MANGEEIEIADATMGSNNNVIVLTLNDYLSFYDQITVSASAGTLVSSSNDNLLGFSNFDIVNLLDKINLIPGKIEAERFDDQNGIGVEEPLILDLVQISKICIQEISLVMRLIFVKGEIIWSSVE